MGKILSFITGGDKTDTAGDKNEFSICGATTIGRRQENQDSYWGKVFDPQAGCLHAIAVVCDGMGGFHGGREASTDAIKAFKRCLVYPPASNDEVAGWIEHTIGAMQEELIRRSTEVPAFQNMGTTVVMALFTDSSVWIAHVGDSRAYRVKDSHIEQLTLDHNVAQDTLTKGLLSLEEIRAKASAINAEALIRNLGKCSTDYAPEIKRYDRANNEFFLLCTDGLTGSILNPVMKENIILMQALGTKTLQQAAANLTSIAFQAGSRDNITVVFIEAGTCKRSVVRQAIQPSVEKLLAKEQRSKAQHFLWSIIAILAVIAIALGAICIYMYQSKVKADVAPEPSSSKLVTGTLANFSAQSLVKPISIEWSNVSSIRDEVFRFDEPIVFVIRNGTKDINSIALIAGKGSEMTDAKEDDISGVFSHKAEYGMFTASQIGLPKGRWFLQVQVVTSGANKTSAIRKVRIVGR